MAKDLTAVSQALRDAIRKHVPQVRERGDRLEIDGVSVNKESARVTRTRGGSIR